MILSTDDERFRRRERDRCMGVSEMHGAKYGMESIASERTKEATKAETKGLCLAVQGIPSSVF